MIKSRLHSVRSTLAIGVEVLMYAACGTAGLWIWSAYGASVANSIIEEPSSTFNFVGTGIVVSVVAAIVVGLNRWVANIRATRQKLTPDEDGHITLFSRAIRTTSDGMALTDLDGTFIWANEGMSNMTGYALDEIIGKTPRLFKSGKQNPGVYKKLWSTVLSGMIFQGEFINRRKDGSLFTAQVTITPITEKKGVVTHFSVVSRDITKRVEAEESLRQGQERFRLLVESMNDSLVMIDTEERIQYANPMFLSKMGYSAKEMLNFNFMDLLDEENKAIVQKQMEERRTGGRHSYDLEFVNRSGSLKTFKISPSGLFDREGNLTGSIAVLRDVTLERETERKLVVAKDLAESTSRFQSNMLDNISHEFRTPLAGILGFSEVLAESASGDQAEMIDHIQSAAMRLMRSLNTLIEMSSILSDTDEIAIQECFIDQEIVDLIPPWTRLAAEKDIVLSTRLSVGDCPAELNISQFRSIVESLIDNAIKFTEKGTIRVATRLVESDVFEVLVQDTGIGIDKEAQQAIFEPFHQESSGTTRTHIGLGLGLSVVRLLVVKMGGDIRVTSLKRVGSEFAITLPLIQGGSTQHENLQVENSEHVHHKLVHDEIAHHEHPVSASEIVEPSHFARLRPGSRDRLDASEIGRNPDRVQSPEKVQASERTGHPNKISRLVKPRVPKKQGNRNSESLPN